MSDEMKRPLKTYEICSIFLIVLMIISILAIAVIGTIQERDQSIRYTELKDSEKGLYVVYDEENDKYCVYHDPYCKVELIPVKEVV